jgi:hypothetical protein
LSVEYVKPEAVIESAAKVVELKRARAEQERPTIKATPYVWKDPADIPVREFVYGRHFIRRFISGTVSPGGLGKSSLSLVEALAMASGRALLGVKVPAPLRVWYWNGEDPMDELERRVAAICLHYGIKPADLDGRFFLNSGRDCEIVLATETKEGAEIAEPVIDDLEATITENAIDVWIFDPFVSVHAVSENDNGKIGAIMKALALLADRTNTAGELVHHVRKPRESAETSVDDARGAKAFSDRARSIRTLNRMSKEEAMQLGVDERERHLLFRCDVGKANLFAPSFQAIWRRLLDVNIGNGGNAKPDDHVGVVVAWEPRGLFDDVRPADVLEIQRRVQAGRFREDMRAAAWVGTVVADVLGLDPHSEPVRQQVKQMVGVWLRSGALKSVMGKDERRKDRLFVEVGKWAEAS